MKKHLYKLFTVLFILMFALAACGEGDFEDEFYDEDEPYIEENFDEPLEDEFIDEEPVEEPIEEPAEEPVDVGGDTGALNDEYYTHPSDLFSFLSPGDPDDEGEDYVIFSDNRASLFAFYLEGAGAVSPAELQDISTFVLDNVITDFGFVTEYELFADQYQEIGDGFLVPFDYTSSETDAGLGDLYLSADNGLLYVLSIFTEDYDAIADDWGALLDSFEPGSASVAGTDTTPDTTTPSDSGSTAPPADLGEADSGFRPTVNGFSFENYGNESVSSNLTPTELQRMFGDQVCASLSGGTCTLTPPAKQWMNQINNYMDGGHCEGMATLSLLMYYGQVPPTDFGGSVAYDLRLSNEPLQREIAYWWTTQSVYPAATFRIDESPSAVVEQLEKTYSDPNADESWTIGIYQPDFSGGHAITPFAIEDQGGGITHILVYDNNFPGETRRVIVDVNEETWEYQASTNPNEPSELYKGDESTRTLEIIPTSNRLGKQECEFCAGGGNGGVRSARGVAFQTQSFNQIWLEGDADLLITDQDGNRTGFVDGKFINEIPGAEANEFKYMGIEVWNVDKEPVYQIPLGVEFTITVDAGRATEGITSTVAMIGPGYDLVVADLYLDPGTSDVITISPDGSRLAYSTEYNDAPDMIFGVETPEADYEFIVAALDIESGAEFLIELDTVGGTLSINTNNTTEYGVYEIVMYRIDDEGEVVFQNNDIYLEPGDTTYLKYLEWEGPGNSLFIDIDYMSDGSIDETIELIDEYEE